MKKTIIALSIAGIGFFGCKKDPDPVSKVVTVSYPTINLIGAAVVHVAVNGTYSDQGATLIDDISGASSSISPTVNEVDVTTPGIYAVKYEAANSNGFKTTAQRVVLVLDYTPPGGLDPNLDLSGLWQRTNGIFTTVYRIDVGLYVMDNFGGSTTILPAYFTTPTNTTVDCPPQTTIHSTDIDATGETLAFTPDTAITWAVVAPNFGTQARKFIKQ